jgi:hypothetical protein
MKMENLCNFKDKNKPISVTFPYRVCPYTSNHGNDILCCEYNCKDCLNRIYYELNNLTHDDLMDAYKYAFRHSNCTGTTSSYYSNNKEV